MIAEIRRWFPETKFEIVEDYADAIIGIDFENLNLVYSVAKLEEIIQKKMGDGTGCFKLILKFNEVRKEIKKKYPSTFVTSFSV